MTKFSKIIVLFLIVSSVIGLIILMASGLTRKGSLPILGEPGHVVGKFAFKNQEGKLISEKDIDGKITVVEYFFTSCPGICKVMNKNLNRVYNTFKGASDFTILSHTVDPETDSITVLAKYAQQFKANSMNWQFLTGDKTKLYEAAKKDYLLAVDDQHASSIADEFIHTEYVALLDKERRIRGFYDATDSLSINRLIKDVKRLRDY